MTCKYTNQQTDQLRTELNKVYNALISDDIIQSWPELGTFIAEQLGKLEEDEWETIFERRIDQLSKESISEILKVEFDTDNFRKFATGENSTMKPRVKLLALDIFLCDVENQYSTLTSEKLFNKSMLPKVASLLTDHLHDNTDYEPFLKTSQLTGHYQFQSSKLEANLYLNIVKHPHLLSAKIVELHKSDSANKKNMGEKSVEYTGWVLIAPDDGLFGIFQNNSLLTNHMIFPIAVDDGVNNHDSAEELTFLNQPSEPIYTKLQSALSPETIASNWLFRDESNVLKFKRQIESS